MFLQGPDVSSIFAAQIIKQPKRMTVKQCNFKVGEVYLFHTDDPRCPDAESIIGKTKCDGIQNQMRLFGGRVSPKRKATKISHTHTKKHRSNGF